ncbi:MAG: excisionase family DNA-binding protein [Acutalibacteraceae bacterium]|nr:excisionase family DNA-binding protein [Acutalibacteraceae bacterium]
MNIIEMQPKFVTVKEAVKSTGMSEHFIRENLKSGKIPHIMVGKKYLINLPLFNEWLMNESRKGGTNG